jgi:hypothetical protein
MIYQRNLILVFFLLCSSKLLFGQNLVYNLPPNNFYEKATIGFINFQKFEVTNMSILSDTLEYVRNGETIRTHFKEINYIRVNEGSKAREGALIGGGSMLFITMFSIMQVENDPNRELKDNAGGTLVLLTLGGAVLGGLIGSGKQKQTSYYIHASPK